MAKNTCFVMMPFDPAFNPIYTTAIQEGIEAAKLACVRADEELRFGKIDDQFSQQLNASTICLADLTGLNSNVLFEVGMAIQAKKPIVMITQDALKGIPFDIRQYRMHRYGDTPGGLAELRAKITKAITDTLEDEVTVPMASHVPLLREMLAPESLGDPADNRFVVAASPLSRRDPVRREGGYTMLRRTSSDQAGIRGLIQAFGSIFALQLLPDLLDPNDYDDAALENRETSANLYCIASPKSNRWTGYMLKRFYHHWTPRIEFLPDPDSRSLRNVDLLVRRDGHDFHPPEYKAGTPRRDWDFGFVIRGPNPVFDNRMLMVLAGRSALGTKAASLAATHPEHIDQIKQLIHERNADFDLNDHRQAFWAVVSLASNTQSPAHEADLADLKISYAAACSPAQ